MLGISVTRSLDVKVEWGTWLLFCDPSVLWKHLSWGCSLVDFVNSEEHRIYQTIFFLLEAREVGTWDSERKDWKEESVWKIIWYAGFQSTRHHKDISRLNILEGKHQTIINHIVNCSCSSHDDLIILLKCKEPDSQTYLPNGIFDRPSRIEEEETP